eukprot:5049073-Prorocentrum_lima.AAC.1
MCRDARGAPITQHTDLGHQRHPLEEAYRIQPTLCRREGAPRTASGGSRLKGSATTARSRKKLT